MVSQLVKQLVGKIILVVLKALRGLTSPQLPHRPHLPTAAPQRQRHPTVPSTQDLEGQLLPRLRRRAMEKLERVQQLFF